MGLQGSDGNDGRFSRYVEGLASVIGHADRVKPLRDYCTGLMMPCERKSVEPMAAVTAPARTAAQHQSLLHFVGQASWSDEKVLAKVCETVLPAIERAGLNKFTISYAKTLLAGTPDAQLAPGRKRVKPRGVTDEQFDLMQRESANLDREFRLIEESYGPDHLDLVLAKGYLGRLVGNEKVSLYLDRHHKDILSELIQIAE